VSLLAGRMLRDLDEEDIGGAAQLAREARGGGLREDLARGRKDIEWAGLDTEPDSNTRLLERQLDLIFISQFQFCGRSSRAVLARDG